MNNFRNPIPTVHHNGVNRIKLQVLKELFHEKFCKGKRIKYQTLDFSFMQHFFETLIICEWWSKQLLAVRAPYFINNWGHILNQKYVSNYLYLFKLFIFTFAHSMMENINWFEDFIVSNARILVPTRKLISVFVKISRDFSDLLYLYLIYISDMKICM